MIGIDIVSIKRIERFIERFGEKGLLRFLTPKEIELIKSPKSAAGFWAAKEAVAKAVGCGISKEFSFFDIIIYKDKRGAPKVKLSQKVKDYFCIKECNISISHDGDYAIAVAVVL